MSQPFRSTARSLSGLTLLVILLTLSLAACGDNAAQPAAVTTTVAPTTAAATEIKIGVIYTTSGSTASLGQDALRGMELALAEFGGKIGDRKITLVKEGTDATSAMARTAVRKLVEQDNVDLVIGPLSGDEGLAVRNYARTQPNKVFINGSSAAQDATLRDPAPNFYRFSTDGVQRMAGLGSYVYQTKNYKRIVTLAEDYSYPYSQVGGFMTEFCKAGGKVAQKFWVPQGTSDFSAIVPSIPTDIDAILVVLTGSSAVNFLKQYDLTGGKAPLIGGTSTVDQAVLGLKGSFYERVLGTPTSSAISDNNTDPAWVQFVQSYKTKFPEGFPSPSIQAHSYYVNTKAALLGLKQVNGDFSNGSQKFKEALSNLQFDSPTGPIKLDKNRNAIVNIYLNEVDKRPDGSLYTRLIKTIPNVSQTLGLPEADFLGLGVFGRDNPTCA